MELQGMGSDVAKPMKPTINIHMKGRLALFLDVGCNVYCRIN